MNYASQTHMSSGGGYYKPTRDPQPREPPPVKRYGGEQQPRDPPVKRYDQQPRRAVAPNPSRSFHNQSYQYQSQQHRYASGDRPKSPQPIDPSKGNGRRYAQAPRYGQSPAYYSRDRSPQPRE